MNLNDLHRRLLQDVLEIGNTFPLVITGGYAVQAHRIVDRFSRDIDMATESGYARGRTRVWPASFARRTASPASRATARSSSAASSAAVSTFSLPPRRASSSA